MAEEIKITPRHGPTLSKLGADLRWFVEQNKVDAERVRVGISVKTKEEADKLIKGLRESFDPHTMRFLDDYPNMIVLHGVPFWILADKAPKESA